MKNFKLILIVIIVFITRISYSQLTTGELVFNPQLADNTLQQVDINGDGLMDLHMLDEGGFEAYLNKGDFKFSSKGIFVFDESVQIEGTDRVVFIDVDGDGDQDLIVSGCSACGSEDLHWFENTDGISFTYVEPILDEFGSLGLPAFAVDDFDGDGDEDFVLMSNDFTDLQLRLFDNTSSGFEIISERVIEDVSVFLNPTKQVDQNGNGINEILISGGGGVNHVYVENGEIMDPIFIDNGRLNIQKIDYNTDGLEDLVYHLGNSLFVMYGNGTSYEEPLSVFVGTTCESNYYLHDYDMDGTLDLVHGFCTDFGVFWRKGDQNSFGQSQQLSKVGFQITEFLKNDFNNDATEDLIILGNDGFLGAIDISNTLFTNVIASYQAINHKASVNVDGDADIEINIFSGDWAGVIDPENGVYQGATTYFNNSFKDRITDVSYFDFDGDNDKDMFVLFDASSSSSEDTTMIWLENNNMSFSNPRLVYSELLDGGSFTHADYDQDGDEDIAIFSLFYANEYLENKGDGTFEKKQTLGGTSWNAIDADIDQDGWLDIVGYGADGRAYYFKNDTQGGFEARQLIGTIQDPRSCAISNLDNSGSLEIVCSNFTELVVFQYVNGDFVERTELNGFYSGLGIADLNGDNLPDIISGEDLTYFQNNDNFQFQEVAGVGNFTYNSMEVIDLNQDAYNDLIGYGFDAFSGGVFVHRNVDQVVEQDIDMDGFTTSEDCDDMDPDINPDAIEIVNNDVDENCDGIIEVIDDDGDNFNSDEDCDDSNPNVNPGEDEVPYNGIDDDCDSSTPDDDIDMDGFLLADDCDDDNPSVNPNAIEIPNNTIDEDCDGMDLILPDSLNQVILYSGDQEINNVYARDINNDNLADIIGSGEDELFIYINLGGHTYNRLVLDSANNGRFMASHVSDLDGDGLMDIVGCREGAGRIYWYRNLGDSSFSAPIFIDNGLVSRDVYTGDLDNDGDQDIVANGWQSGGSDGVYVYLNEGTGEFEDGFQVINNASVVRAVLPYDIDEDGDLDIFATDAIGDRVLYVENLGNANFGTQITAASQVNGAMSLSISDYNKDGNINIAVAENQTASSVLGFYMKPDGTFSDTERITFGILNGQVTSVFFYDFDNDGYEEMFFSDFNTDKIGYLKNNEGELLSDEIILSDNSENAMNVFVEDLDNDGDGDVLYSLGDGREIGYFINHLITSSVQTLGEITIKIFPNPSNQSITIETTEDLKIHEVSMYSMIGHKVLEHKQMVGNVVDLGDLPSGAYVIHVNTDKGILTDKILKY